MDTKCCKCGSEEANADLKNVPILYFCEDCSPTKKSKHENSECFSDEIKSLNERLNRLKKEMEVPVIYSKIFELGFWLHWLWRKIKRTKYRKY